MSAWIPYLAYRGARAAWRGVRSAVGSRAAASIGRRALGSVAGSLAGMAVGAARRAFRRRRRARAWAFMKGYRQRAALGLALNRHLVSLKGPAAVLWTSGSKISNVWRFCPLYYFGNGSAGGISYQGGSTPFKLDERFKALCGLYKQFRIVSYSLSLYFDTSGAVSVSPISVYARVIRNCTKTTPPSKFMLNSDGIVYVPGILYKRQLDLDKKLVFNLSLRPRTTLEKLQWFSTDYTSTGSSADLEAGVQTDFCPCIDVALIGHTTAAGNLRVECDYMERIVVEFRDAEDDISNPSSKTVTLEMTRANTEAMRDAVTKADANLETVLDDNEVVLDQ